MTDEIKTWLNAQHSWVQEAAFRILSNGELVEDDFVELIDIIKGPLESTDESREYPNIGAASSGSNDLKIVSIGPVEGIDALNPRNPLSFGSGNMTLVYGDNGSGKTGYIRIFKRFCGKAFSSDLKPNVFKDLPEHKKCSVAYSIDGTETSTEWDADADPIPSLESVDIFDSQSGKIYLENETELSYSPPELALFADLVNACRKIADLLNLEKDKLVPKLPAVPMPFSTSDAGKAYVQLKHDASATQLSALCDWGEQDETDLAAITKRLEVADPALEAKRKKAIKVQIDSLITNINTAFSLVKPDACNNIKNLTKVAQQKRLEATEGTQVLKESTKVEGIGSGTWRSLWEAARDYSNAEAYPENAFPYTKEGAHCVLCHQELDEEAKKRLEGFESFVVGKLATDAVSAEKLLEETHSELPEKPSDSELETVSQAADLSEEQLQELKDLWKEIEGVVATLDLDVELSDVTPAVTKFATALTEKSKALETIVEQLEEDAKTFNRGEVFKEQIELRARKWTSEQADAIRVEISRLKSIEQIGSGSMKLQREDYPLRQVHFQRR